MFNNFLILYFQADASLELERRDFIRAGLEYVCLIQEVQERKKFEFVETVSTNTIFRQPYDPQAALIKLLIDLCVIIQIH